MPSALELRNTVVSHNAAKAIGPSGVAEGGGIWNGVFLSGPPVELTLTDSLITHNVLAGGAGDRAEGRRAVHDLPGHAHAHADRRQRPGSVLRLRRRRQPPLGVAK